MAARHYYAVLGVDPDVDLDELRRAYRALAARWHPDSPRGDERRFKVIADAWQALADPRARASYDAALAAAAASRVPRQIWVDRVLGVRPRGPEAGRNRRYRVTVGVGDVIRGAERVVELPTAETCTGCGGAGWAAAGPPLVCGGCGGRSEVVTRPVLRATWSVCERCHGRGWIPEVACVTCAGLGETRGSERLVVPIPAGVRHGEVLRVQGKGELGAPGDPAGDLLVEVAVDSESPFTIVGRDVRHARVVPFWKGLAGGPIEVATAWGAATVHVPAGSKTGDELRLAGYGVAHKGDQIVTLELEWPTRLDAAARAALAAWGEGQAEAFPRSERARRGVSS